MMVAALALAGLAADIDAAAPVPKVWNSIDNDFTCTLHMVQGQPIHIEGSMTETVTETELRIQTASSFRFRSQDAKWRFLAGKSGSTGSGLLGTHSYYVENIDDPTEPGFKPYSLQLTFANRVAGLTGAYAYVVLRDQSQNVELVKQGSDYPILAAGACLMTPKAGANG